MYIETYIAVFRFGRTTLYIKEWKVKNKEPNMQFSKVGVTHILKSSQGHEPPQNLYPKCAILTYMQS